MTPGEAQALRMGAKVLWAFEQTLDYEPTPGTVTASDKNGAFIFWADSLDIPTYYAFDQPESWEHIEIVTEERHYEPISQPISRILQKRKATQ